MRPRYQPTREEQREAALAAKHAKRMESYDVGGKNEQRCMCLHCGAADGCEAASEQTVVGDEVSLELCRRCCEDHASLALAVMESALW